MAKIEIDKFGIVPEDWMYDVIEVSILKNSFDSRHSFDNSIQNCLGNMYLYQRELFDRYTEYLMVCEEIHSMANFVKFFHKDDLDKVINELYEKAKLENDVKKEILGHYFYTYDEYSDIVDENYDRICEEKNVTDILTSQLLQLKEKMNDDVFDLDFFRRHDDLEAIVDYRLRHGSDYCISFKEYEEAVGSWASKIDEVIEERNHKLLVNQYSDAFDEDGKLVKYEVPVTSFVESTDAWNKEVSPEFKQEFKYMVDQFSKTRRYEKIK